MTKETLNLINLLGEGRTVEEMCSQLNLTSSQLFIRLKNLKAKGFYPMSKYYSSGDILFYLAKDLEKIAKAEQREASILVTKPEEQELRLLGISDLHYGNVLERPDLVNQVFDYCKKNGIHIVVLCGDMIDGTFTGGQQKESNVYNQMDNFIKCYPKDDHILTFAVGGDHDLSAMEHTGQDFLVWLKEARKDIVAPSYSSAIVYVKNDKIVLFHTCNDKGISGCSSILLRGHNHKYLVRRDKNINVLNIYVPSLSNIGTSIPSFLDITLKFYNGLVDDAYIKQLAFIDSSSETPVLLNEVELYGIKNPNYVPKFITSGDYKTIMNEQNYGRASSSVYKGVEAAQPPKTLERVPDRPSQTERFNKRWGGYFTNNK